jgi:hypothetical protein
MENEFSLHYCIHNSSPLVPIWSTSIHSTRFLRLPLKCILKLHSHLRLGLASDLLPSGFPTRNLYTPPPLCDTRPAHPIRVDLISLIIGLFRAEFKLWSSSSCSFVEPLVTSSSQAQISLAPYVPALPTSILSSIWETTFRIQIHQAKLWFRIFKSLYYRIAHGKWRVYGHSGSRTTRNSHVLNFVTHHAFIFKGLRDIDVWPLATNQLQEKRHHIPEGRSPLTYKAVPFTAYVL